MPLDSAALVWFRRDLRILDHAALHAALSTHGAVHCAFVFDTDILDPLPSRGDRRVEFIWESVRELKAALEARGGGLHVLHGRAREEIPRLARKLGVKAVYANRAEGHGYRLAHPQRPGDLRAQRAAHARRRRLQRLHAL
jgi:deoxyribodipyrimidine photo-lyase